MILAKGSCVGRSPPLHHIQDLGHAPLPAGAHRVSRERDPGEEPFAEDEDWGYGPPRYLRPERVQLAAEALRATSYAQLISGVDPAELTRAEVYPLGWSEADSLEWGR